MKKKFKNGFTLTETLVAIVIGMISVAAIFSSYNYFNKTHNVVSEKLAISKSAREALTTIARDLRNAGYININYTKDSNPHKRVINVRQKYLGNLDSLAVWYTPTSDIRQRIYYRPMKYRNSNDIFLAREVVNNPVVGGQAFKIIYDNIEFISFISDFQVVLRDKDGKELVPVCTYCGSVENSQGSRQEAQDNMQKVHTAEVYITVRSAKEVYKKNKQIRIKNHEGSNGNTQTFNDKYYRETFYVSVHTRNLAIPQVKIASSGQSIGVGAGYNK